MPPSSPFSSEANPNRAIDELHTSIMQEDMQEIISRPPSWLLRWGMTIMLAVTGGVLVACYLVRYPEQLAVPMRLTSVAAPVAVAATQPGRLRLLMAPGATAAPGQALAYLETTTNFAQARHLGQQLRALRAQLVAATPPSPENIPQTAEYNRLGKLEEYFVAFKQAEAATRRAAPSLATTERLLQALDLLSSRLDEWEQACVLTAPIAGRASYAMRLHNGQAVEAGQALFYMVPPRAAADVYGELAIAQEYSSKVRTEQPVLIEVDGYPAGEVGLVVGRVASIAEVAAADGTRHATVLLPMGMKTDHQRLLPYSPGMQARAKIVVGNPRLLQKLVAHFR